MTVKPNYISVEEAKALNEIFKKNGCPTENRLLIVTPNEDFTQGGIIIPGSVKEGMPRKGVVIHSGEITTDYKSYRNIEIGMIITYGLYAGKELDMDTSEVPANLKEKLNHSVFSVLSLSEVIYIESNH